MRQIERGAWYNRAGRAGAVPREDVVGSDSAAWFRVIEIEQVDAVTVHFATRRGGPAKDWLEFGACDGHICNEGQEISAGRQDHCPRAEGSRSRWKRVVVAPRAGGEF